RPCPSTRFRSSAGAAGAGDLMIGKQIGFGRLVWSINVNVVRSTSVLSSVNADRTRGLPPDPASFTNQNAAHCSGLRTVSKLPCPDVTCTRKTRLVLLHTQSQPRCGGGHGVGG